MCYKADLVCGAIDQEESWKDRAFFPDSEVAHAAVVVVVVVVLWIPQMEGKRGTLGWNAVLQI